MKMLMIEMVGKNLKICSEILTGKILSLSAACQGPYGQGESDWIRCSRDQHLIVYNLVYIY